jgi:hypothetical protein
MHEGEESLAFEWEHQMRKRRALKLLGEKWTLSVSFPVDDDRPTGRESECGAWPSIFERFAGDHRYRRQISVERASHFSNCCRQQNLVSKSNQCLRESFEQRYISADENHFYH